MVEAVLPMADSVTRSSAGRRSYHSPRRAEQAARTRRAILSAARELFVAKGYGATTIAAIAERARVSLDTVYATVGRKPALLRELVETAISGTDEALPPEQRDYVRRIGAAATAVEKILIYAAAVSAIQQRLAPVFRALRDAARTDEDCAALWAEISTRRATNMRSFAADLRGTGELRDDLTDDQVADVVWSMNAAEYWDLLVRERGWTPDQFRDWLADAWSRLLLKAS
jgi:AcrR family transcriptional regulator